MSSHLNEAVRISDRFILFKFGRIPNQRHDR
jgi:hypothetical protein